MNRAKIKQVRISSLDLLELITQIVDPIRIHAETTGVSIGVKCPSGIVIKADRDLLPLVFLNLLHNSLYFLESDSKPGERRITISASERDQFAVVHFHDNGPGISPYDQDKVFDAFFTTKSEKGMGFGLAIAKTIIEAHGGAISVRSTWGFDTEFTVSIPLKEK